MNDAKDAFVLLKREGWFELFGYTECLRRKLRFLTWSIQHDPYRDRGLMAHWLMAQDA